MAPGEDVKRESPTIGSEETAELASSAGTWTSPQLVHGAPPAAPPAEGALLGKTLAHFRVLELLGQGGMGQVYRAADQRLEREVALKVIHAGATSHPGWRERLLREARAAAAVSHRHIASVYEVGEDGDQSYIAMELVEGKTLRHALGAALPLDEALRLALQIARGLERAHDKHVIHRDLKPENMMVTVDGDVKILDFGIAKRMSAAPVPERVATGGQAARTGDTPVAPGLTQEGSVMGTPGYMSPEQILGQELDHRTDVFSFGVTLYEMVTGAAPFEGNMRQKLFETLEGTPRPPAQLGKHVPPALDRLIMRCLAKKREDRPASMGDVARALSRLATESFGAGAFSPQVEPASAAWAGTPSVGVSRSVALPSGSVTLLVAMVAEASVLLEQHGEAYADILASYHGLAALAAERRGGTIVSAAAEQVVAAFTDPRGALDAAVDAQRRFHAEAWPGGAAVRVRIGLHTGEPRIAGGQYSGLDVHRATHIAESTPGGQVCLSAATRMGVGEGAIDGLTLRDLGAIRVKNLHFPEHVFALSIEGLAVTRSLSRAFARARSRLPEQPTAFVGRAKLIADVKATLARDDVRLVTLTGPGGTGKTRLSIEVARAVEATFPDGAVQVRLGAVTDPALVLPTIARALDLPEVPGTPPLDVLANGLGASALLLVLDNFEQVVDAAGAVADLLAACGGLKVLVTSREVLRVRGEHEVGVPPLELPGGGRGASFEAIAASEAVRLFADRARQISPAFALTPENAPLVSAICARLDAIPLAIELAASRTRMLTLEALLRKLDDRLGFVKATERDRDPRHRTLRATIDWSHDLLDEPSRILFRRVSVFRGGFSLESAEAVCGEGLDVDVFEGLSSLVGKSLLRLSEVDGAPRIGALETIREYGRERLEASGEAAPVLRRHAEHFAAFVEALAPGLLGRDWRRHAGALLTEIDNVRAALDWALGEPTAALTVRMVKALQWFWSSYGRVAEGLGFVDRALAQTALDGATEERAAVLEAASWLRAISGDVPAAIAHSAEGIAVWKALGREAEGARTEVVAGAVTAATGSFPDGVAAVERAYATCRSRGDRFGVAIALSMLAELARASGNFPEALARNEELQRLLREMGDVIHMSMFALNLAWCHLHAGDWARAAEAVIETLELSRQMDNPVTLAYYLAVMASVAVVRGKHAEGLRLFGAADTTLRSFGGTAQPGDQAAMDEYAGIARAALGEEAAAAARREGAALTREQAIALTLPLRS